MALKYSGLNYRINRRLITSTYDFIDKLRSVWGPKPLDYRKKDLLLHIDSPREYFIRSHSCAKEPGTIDWLESNVTNDTILYDIGANVGAYSLVAASLGATVYAFEPAYQNFYQLNRNVSLNKLDHKIKCFPIGLSSQSKLASFKYFETSPGTSKCYYNEDDYFHLDLKVEVEKSTMIFSLDEFIKNFSLPSPTMLKIDVDGGEGDVVSGAIKTLRSPELKTVQVEIDESKGERTDIHDLMSKQTGHTLKSKEEFDLSVSNYIYNK